MSRNSSASDKVNKWINYLCGDNLPTARHQLIMHCTISDHPTRGHTPKYVQSINDERHLNFKDSTMSDNILKESTVVNFVTEIPAPQASQSRPKRKIGTAIGMAANVTKQPRKKEEEGKFPPMKVTSLLLNLTSSFSLSPLVIGFGCSISRYHKILAVYPSGNETSHILVN